MDHRSDIEEFFLESLDTIKERAFRRVSDEVEQLMKIKEEKLGESELKNGGYSQPMITVNRERFYENFRISELTLEDREQLLRLVFSRMNSGVPPRHWRTPDNEYPNDLLPQEQQPKRPFDDSFIMNQQN